MLIRWDEQYLVHVTTIDEQHKRLIGTINMLHTAMAAGKGAGILAEIFSRLTEYTLSHFLLEEMYMTKFAYPDYEAHQKEHQAFRDQLKRFQEQFAEKRKPTASIEVAYFLKDWFLHHFMVVDKKYSQYFHDHGLT